MGRIWHAGRSLETPDVKQQLTKRLLNNYERSRKVGASAERKKLFRNCKSFTNFRKCSFIYSQLMKQPAQIISVAGANVSSGRQEKKW